MIIDSLNGRFASSEDYLKRAAKLCPDSWPDKTLFSERYRLFGETELCCLAGNFGYNPESCLFEFRAWKYKGTEPTGPLKLLIDDLKCLPITSSEAERGFSTMNDLHNADRNRLSVERVSGE